MKEVPFRVWLKVERGLSAGTEGSRISNCRRVERHEGDLDVHYDFDELDGLLQRLKPGEARARDPDCRRRVQRHGDAEERGQPLFRFPERWRPNGFFGGRSGKATAATGAESAIASTVARLAATDGRGPPRTRPGDGAVRAVSRSGNRRRCGRRQPALRGPVVRLSGSARHRSRHLSLGGLALCVSGGSAVCRKHGDRRVPETGQAQ